jgi:hypothetical protein
MQVVARRDGRAAVLGSGCIDSDHADVKLLVWFEGGGVGDGRVNTQPVAAVDVLMRLVCA